VGKDKGSSRLIKRPFSTRKNLKRKNNKMIYLKEKFLKLRVHYLHKKNLINQKKLVSHLLIMVLKIQQQNLKVLKNLSNKNQI